MSAVLKKSNEINCCSITIASRGVAVDPAVYFCFSVHE